MGLSRTISERDYVANLLHQIDIYDDGFVVGIIFSFSVAFGDGINHDDSSTPFSELYPKCNIVDLSFPLCLFRNLNKIFSSSTFCFQPDS